MFGPNSNFYHALSLAADLVIVNLLMILTSVPVVTAGASMRAGQHVIAKMLAEEGAYPVRLFVSEFRRHWKASTLWNLIVVGVGILVAYEWYIVGRAALSDSVTFVLRAGLVSGVLVIVGITVWFYYREATDPRAFRESFMRAALESVRYLPRTLICLWLLALPVIILMAAPSQWLVLLFFYVIIGVALTGYLSQLVLRGVDKK